MRYAGVWPVGGALRFAIPRTRGPCFTVRHLFFAWFRDVDGSFYDIGRNRETGVHDRQEVFETLIPSESNQ